jgi:polysaccharide export outer membrane protein
MKMKAHFSSGFSLLGLAIVLMLASCGVSKKAHEERLYLQGIDSSLVEKILFQEPRIQKNDLLTILIYSDNREATEIYNQPQNGGSAGAAGANMAGQTLSALGRGYQVDVYGNIFIHQGGQIYVEGKTRQEVAAVIVEKLKEYLKNPYVVVRFANRRVTVLGEVNKPGVIELPDQQMTILQAIGLSGDLTVYGKRDNILVIREENNVRTSGRLNIRDPHIYASPFFYLKQNDVVYIEPTRRKTAGNEAIFVRNVSIIASVISVVTVAISLLTR